MGSLPGGNHRDWEAFDRAQQALLLLLQSGEDQASRIRTRVAEGADWAWHVMGPKGMQTHETITCRKQVPVAAWQGAS
jgi:hypothetical protein